jgi:hypothetical protein
MFSPQVQRRWLDSQLRAKSQSRRKVATEMPSASAASVSVRPPKNRSSMTFTARVERLEADQSLINGEDSLIELPGAAISFEERSIDLAAPTFVAPDAARMLDQHSSQLLGGNGEEMDSVLPLNRLRTAQAHVNFVHEGGRLQRVFAPLAAHFPGGSLHADCGCGDNIG